MQQKIALVIAALCTCFPIYSNDIKRLKSYCKTAMGIASICVGGYACNVISRTAILPVYNTTSDDDGGIYIPINNSAEYLHVHAFNPDVYEISQLSEISKHDRQSGHFIIVYYGNDVTTCNSRNYVRNIIQANRRCNTKTYVIQFTYPSVGNSGGSFKTFAGLCQQSRSVFDYLHDTIGIPSENILHYGHSIGGAVATDVVAQLCREGKLTHLRCDRSIMRLDGYFPDKIIDRTNWQLMNSIARWPCYALLKLQGLYPETYQAWQDIPDQYKDYVQIVDDEAIPKTSSFAQEIQEQTDNGNQTHKYISADINTRRHKDNFPNSHVLHTSSLFIPYAHNEQLFFRNHE